jgi:hypothetical protein
MLHSLNGSHARIYRRNNMAMQRRDYRHSVLLILTLMMLAILFAQSRRDCEIPGSSWVPCIWGQPLKKYQADKTVRRFPAPWTVEKIPGALVVRDANGQSLAYVYSRENRDETAIAKVLTEDEARGIAANIAKLPELLNTTANKNGAE